MSNELDNLDSYELEGELWILADGTVVESDEPPAEDSELVLVANDGKRYDEVVSVDWKADPDTVVDQINHALRLKGSELVFVSIDCGDDSYHFGLERS